MLSGFLFILWRCVEIFFLVPPLGMLSWFVQGYMQANSLTPTMILVLFIVVVLAFVWAIMTLVFFAMARHNGYLLAFVDLGLFAALIAGIYELREAATANCSSVDVTSDFYIQLGVFVYQSSKACSMLKASFAFAILETMMFFTTFLLALWVHHHHRNDDRPTRDEHYTRHSHRRSRAGSQRGGSQRAGSRSRYGDDRSYRASSRNRSSRRSNV